MSLLSSQASMDSVGFINNTVYNGFWGGGLRIGSSCGKITCKCVGGGNPVLRCTGAPPTVEPLPTPSLPPCCGVCVPARHQLPFLWQCRVIGRRRGDGSAGQLSSVYHQVGHLHVLAVPGQHRRVREGLSLIITTTARSHRPCPPPTSLCCGNSADGAGLYYYCDVDGVDYVVYLASNNFTSNKVGMTGGGQGR